MSVVISCASAHAYENARRKEVDGGVHVPVLTKAPALIRLESAKYPEAAEKQGLTARVRLMVTIGADGAVTEAKVLEPVGNGFDEAAVEALLRSTFTPAEVDFAPAPVQIEFAYTFVLKVAAAEGPDGGASDAGAAPASARLKGQVLVRGSRSRVVGGMVRCEQYAEREAITDDEGLFDLELPPGLCSVRVTGPETEVFKTDEALEPGETKEVRYYAFPKVIGYQTVVRDKREKKEVVRRTITREELQKVPGTFGDPVRVIQNFPGVARAPFISGQLIVRGANPNQTLTFFDGVEIPLLFHLAGGPSVVNAEFLDRVDFYPGGFGARYGRAVGGVVDVASRKGASDTWHGVAKVDFLDSSVFVEAPLAKDVSVAAAARRSYIDVLLPAVTSLATPPNQQGGTINILPVYWDYQVRLDVGKRQAETKDGASTFSVFAFGSDDQLKVVVSGGQRNTDVSVQFRTLFHRVIGNWTYRRGNVQFKLTPYVGYDLASVNFGVANLNADRWTQGLRQDLTVDVSKGVTLRAGADIFNQVLIGQAELPVISGVQYPSFPGAEPKLETQRIGRTVPTFDGAIYLEGDFKAGPLTVTPGLRASHAFLNGETRNAFDPRLWVRFEPWSRTSVKGSVGLYTQPPQATDMEPPPFGTPSLFHEKAFQASLGVSHKFTDVINVDVTGFFNRRFDNVVSPGRRVVNEDGSITQNRSSNDGLGRAYGLEVLARHEVTKNFFGWIAYTLSRSEERRAGSADDYNLTSFDQTHILTAIASYRLPFGFEVGARFRYVTGRPTSPLVHTADYQRLDANRYSNTFGMFRSARVTDFHQLDVRIDKYFVFEKWTLNLYLDVQNVYNRMNTEATIYEYRGRYGVDVPGIPILPILGVRAQL
ncbi:MAG: TonB family protein [Myxococcaceae bacterium]|nr:TonB family protein [Myxococcaceae bacterium]